MTTDNVALLPCPFCGSTNIDAEGWDSESSSGPACDDCGASCGSVAQTLTENIAAWNTRQAIAMNVQVPDIVATILKGDPTWTPSRPNLTGDEALTFYIYDLARERKMYLNEVMAHRAEKGSRAAHHPLPARASHEVDC